MKIKTLLLLTGLVVFHFSYTDAQSTSEIVDFKFTLKKANKGVSLECQNGCSWSNLSFHNSIKSDQWIDQDGMTSNSEEDIAEAKFLINIRRTKNGFELLSIKGTAWDRLTMTGENNRKGIVDQYGISVK